MKLDTKLPLWLATPMRPGGGYGALANHEGEPVAKWLNTLGITGVVLKYRLGPRYRHPAPLQPADQRPGGLGAVPSVSASRSGQLPPRHARRCRCASP